MTALRLEPSARAPRAPLHANAQRSRPCAGRKCVALHYAAEAGDLSTVRLLIEAHADPLLVDNFGRNAAGAAANHREVQKYLYECLSDSVGKSGGTFNSLELCIAAAANDKRRVAALLSSPLSVSQMARYSKERVCS